MQRGWLSSGGHPMKSRIRYGVAILALFSAVGTARVMSAAGPRTIGSFRWDGTTGDVLLERVSPDRLLVQLRIVTASQTSAGSWQSRPLPTGAMEAWVLLE